MSDAANRAVGDWRKYVSRANEMNTVTARPVENFTVGEGMQAVDAEGNDLGYYSVGVFDAIYRPVDDEKEDDDGK